MSITAPVENELEPLPAHKPPFLKRVCIRNYKSIGFCDVELEPFTIFVGKNASGKSNFLDALDFLADLTRMSIADAIQKHGGWNAIRSRYAEKDEVAFEIDFEHENRGAHYEGSYSLVLANIKQFIKGRVENLCSGELRLEELSIRLKNDERSLTKFSYDSYISPNPFRYTTTGSDQIQNVFLSEYQVAKMTEVGTVADTFLRSIGPQMPHAFLVNLALRASKVYNPIPELIRKPQIRKGEGKLSKSGESLTSVLRTIKEKAPSAFRRVNQYLRHIVPEITNVEPVDVFDYETLRFTLASDHELPPRLDRPPRVTRPPIQLEAHSMSDGTLRALAILAASVAFDQFGDPPAFIGIEEPETALHPRALVGIVEALDEATLRTQVFITTHNADLLDVYSVKPEHVRVVEMIDGETWIGRVSEVIDSIVEDKLDTLGGLERQNHLEIDSDDLERQMKLRNSSEVVG